MSCVICGISGSPRTVKCVELLDPFAETVAVYTPGVTQAPRFPIGRASSGLSHAAHVSEPEPVE